MWSVLGICDDILGIDEKIRFVAHLDGDSNLVEMKMRPNVKSLTEETTDEKLYSFYEPVILGVCADLAKDLGDLRSVIMKFGKVSIAFLRIPEAILGISIEPGYATKVLDEIAKRYKISLG